MSLRRYLRKGFDAQAADVELLSSEAELLLWRDTAPNETAHLAEWAAEAWALTQAYRIDCKAPAFGETANGRLFQRWAVRFQAKLEARGWITEAQLADVATARSDVLHLLAFERIEPQAAEHFTRVEQAGGRIHPHKPIPSPAKDQRRVQLNSQAGEISAAAQWARQVLMADGQARIGVVLPYLTDAYQAIDHAFGVEFADAPNAFDLSGGLPLAQQPVWRAAEALLERLLQPPQEILESWKFTPFLELPQSLEKLVQRDPNWTLEERPFAAWVASFRRILVQVQWSANAGSEQFQAAQSIQRCLDRYSCLTHSPVLGPESARRTLQDLLDTQVFAPQRQAAPIQVLGYLETTGLSFTHLWVAGLSDSEWPLTPSPNPLIPLKLQQAASIPRLNHDGERDFAQNRLAHWRTACGSFIASWSNEGTDGPHDCSPLIKPLFLADIDQVVTRYRQRRHPALSEFKPVKLEAHSDPDQASKHHDPIQAGTGLIQDQAKCPLRGWAIHRLKLRPPTALEPFADALTRGSLVHDALFRLYNDGPPPPFADATDQTASEVAVQAAVKGAVEERLGGKPDLFKALEEKRLAKVLNAWLKAEAEHANFTVVGLEQATSLTMDGAQFRLRIDRVNEDPDTGAQVVIDYKTGTLSIRGMVGERLVEPQLPMYALSDDKIEAVLVAQVGNEEVRIDGWSAEGISLGKTPSAGWEPLRERWREQVQSLIDEFRSGHAAASPHNTQVCRYCHLPSLCRINARKAGV